MDAIVTNRDSTSPRLIDVPTPDPGPDEVLVRTVAVGIDGTDHEVIAGNHGAFPPGEDYLVLGHEAVGVVERSPVDGLEEGDIVVPTVRRPPAGETNEYFANDEPDMAPPGSYVERGIDGAHGYMAEYFTSPPEFLIPIPDALASFGFLVEPLSNVEKAIEHAEATRSAFEWNPEAGFVLGNGPLGLLGLGQLEVSTDVDRLYCLGRRDRPDPTIDFMDRLGATYVDSRETALEDVPAEYEAMDLVVEATGVARHAFDLIESLAPGGVGALLGIPGEDVQEVPLGRYHQSMVIENKALFGSVNSNTRHFRQATETLEAFPEWIPEAIVTERFDPGEYEAAFADEGIKNVVSFGSIA
jgi:threonine dehydrogenase-like Zn-dependent dehydrogenase